MHGKIASVSPERGVGSIMPDEEGGEIAFDRSALHGASFEELAPGITVEFMLGQEAGTRPSEGLRAVDVRLVDDTVPRVDGEALSAEKLGQS